MLRPWERISVFCALGRYSVAHSAKQKAAVRSDLKQLVKLKYDNAMEDFIWELWRGEFFFSFFFWAMDP